MAEPYRGKVMLLTGSRTSSAGYLIARNLDVFVRTRLEDVASGIDPDMLAAKRWLAKAHGKR